MTAKLIKGTEIREEILSEIDEEVKKIKASHGQVPGLVTILVGENPASLSYVTLKIKTADFKLHSRSRTLPRPVQSAEQIYQVALDLFNGFSLTQTVRLIGVGAGVLQPESTPVQADLFADGEQVRDSKWEKVDRAMDAVTERFGDLAVTRGKLGHSPKKDL